MTDDSFLPDYLREDAPFVTCSGCGRKSWDRTSAGKMCLMHQPLGGRCVGKFGEFPGPSKFLIPPRTPSSSPIDLSLPEEFFEGKGE